MAASPSKVVWLEKGFFPVCYGFCPNERAWRRELSRLGLPDTPYPEEDGATTEVVGKHHALDSGSIVTINERLDARFRRDKVGLATLLCHEAVHVWQFIRKEMGEQEPSSEFEAYTIQHITDQLCDAYLKTRGAKAARRPRPPTKKRRNARRRRD